MKTGRMQNSIVSFMNEPVQFKSLEIKVDGSRRRPVLKISGSLFTAELLHNIRLERVSPQGVNPKELLLEFCSDSRCPVTKLVYNPFQVSFELGRNDDYQSIKLIYEGWISESFRVR